MKNDYTRDEEARLRDILIKEKFRAFALENGMGDYCVIDRDDYAGLPGAVGCFRQGREWIVYEVGDRSEHFNEKAYPDALTAFQAVASRRGKTFTTTLKHSKFDIIAARKGLITAKRNLEICGLQSKNVQNDIQFLQLYSLKAVRPVSADSTSFVLLKPFQGVAARYYRNPRGVHSIAYRRTKKQQKKFIAIKGSKNVKATPKPKANSH